MSPTVNLKTLEREIQRANFKDGIYDITWGLFMCSMLSPMVESIGIPKPLSILFFSGPRSSLFDIRKAIYHGPTLRNRPARPENQAPSKSRFDRRRHPESDHHCENHPDKTRNHPPAVRSDDDLGIAYFRFLHHDLRFSGFHHGLLYPISGWCAFRNQHTGLRNTVSVPWRAAGYTASLWTLGVCHPWNRGNKSVYIY